MKDAAIPLAPIRERRIDHCGHATPP
jgi:hypothetical protein